MKLLTTAVAAFAGAVLAAPDAAIYTYDTSSSPAAQSIPTISPQNARLVLLNHVGLAPYASLDGADEATLDILAASPEQQPLFTATTKPKEKFLLFVEGAKKVEDVLPEEKGRRRQIANLSPVPSSGRTRNLVCELLSELHQDSSIHEACVLARGTPSDYSGNEEMQEFMRKLQQSHDSSLNVYHYLLPQDQKNYKTASSAGSALVKKLAKVSSLARLDLLVVLIPADASISEQATWDPASLSIAKRAQEKPLGSVGSTAVPSHPFAPMASGNLSQVRTTMERCSKDEKTCNSRTNSCSGHGACTRKFANTNGECWVCQCSATKESYGRQYWGGPACQKRDISVQFWLFAGFAIFAAAAVTWAVGLLYNMGDVELPSVLSAGVAPTSRK